MKFYTVNIEDDVTRIRRVELDDKIVYFEWTRFWFIDTYNYNGLCFEKCDNLSSLTNNVIFLNKRAFNRFIK